jgi:hypothetical protein
MYSIGYFNGKVVKLYEKLINLPKEYNQIINKNKYKKYMFDDDKNDETKKEEPKISTIFKTINKDNKKLVTSEAHQTNLVNKLVLSFD